MFLLLAWLLDLYAIAIIARVILSWVGVPSQHPIGRMAAALGRIVDPAIRAIGRRIPPLRLGSAYLDLSPIVLLVGVRLLREIIF